MEPASDQTAVQFSESGSTDPNDTLNPNPVLDGTTNCPSNEPPATSNTSDQTPDLAGDVPEGEAANSAKPKCGLTDKSMSSQELSAAGKFTRSSQKKLTEMTKEELEDLLIHLPDDTLDEYAKLHGGLELRNGTFLTRARCVIGAIAWFKRKRIRDAHAQKQPTVGWQNWCTSVGLNRKTAERWEFNWGTIMSTPENLVQAAIRAGIDLFQPQTAENLKAVIKKLAGRVPDESELPDLLTQLEARPPEDQKRKSGTKRKNPKPKVPVLNKPQPTPPQSVDELRELARQYLQNHSDEQKNEPFLAAFVEVTPSTPVDKAFRPLFHRYLSMFPSTEREAIAESIALVAGSQSAAWHIDPPKPGDYVQWEQNGIARLSEAKKLTHFSMSGTLGYLEGEAMGYPAGELVYVRPPSGITGAAPEVSEQAPSPVLSDHGSSHSQAATA
jgi:hypothetical protein